MTLCPSARPDVWPGGVSAFGAAAGTPEDPRIDYFPKLIKISKPMLDEMRKGPLEPGEVFRFTGRCKQDGCRQWNEIAHRCSLIDRWITALEPTEIPTTCAVFESAEGCQAYEQSGSEACRRCPRAPAQWITAVDGDPLQKTNLDKVYL